MEHNFVEPLFYKFVDCDQLIGENHGLKDWFQKELGITRFQTIQVIHSYPAYGVLLQNPQWKIVFSGDTRPSFSLAEIGKDCDVLIHESNFEDEFQQKAVRDRHSTVSEAISVGVR